MRPPDDTIVALSTPAGRGAIALLRLSGPDAAACAARIFRAGNLRKSSSGRPAPSGAAAFHALSFEPGRATLGSFVPIAGGEPIDSGYVTLFPEGRSYTGQQMVELTCHASPIVVQALLEELARAGARPADPGEFTYRAVLNGRLDLAQAEGVRDLIDAGTRAAASVAARQVRGELSHRLDGFKDSLVDAICRAEAAVEFAEEPDVQKEAHDLMAAIDSLRALVRAFLATYRQGRLLRDGASVVLAGRPNAGKSSLYNVLLDSPRAIVTAQPGTTRDFLVERVDIGGIPVTLVDTAGLRETSADVERLGVERSREWIERADLVLLLCPVDEPVHPEDRKLLEELGTRAQLIGSKADRPRVEWPVSRAADLLVSAVTREGVAALREAIVRALADAPTLSSDAIVLSHARHHAALESCAISLDRAAGALRDGMTEEVALADLHAALRHLTEITEPVSRDAIHDRIFSTFCIGK